ncbi:MAG: 7-cyano-7-deazaguanine synthase QueC [Methylococcales symbiont of Iophon sp. n. MRB-2018]|nr:MAG: 7-cyano-7-deazaguanine synthase QueC [Methylococcales symbiont of Iophon sp. n. MRB-2018]KAF3979749.1 MAG: 7-cyano-7-deazaguanine synthase QueC [Methylococcales symbiont of Iophon sp. n. MRB-2018]
MQKKAIILLSGGLDSITVLAELRRQNYQCYALSFNYGQKHNAELNAAKKIATYYQVKAHKIIDLGFAAIGGSALTDEHIDVPESPQDGIPVTYVPARNTVFLSFALGWAEVLNVHDIFIGVNAVDYSGYPDCRPEFIKAFQLLANLATKAGVEGHKIKIHAPLIELSKAEIIKKGVALGIDYQQTVSCYSADQAGLACGVCDACRLRIIGFNEAKVNDPTHYQ